jgi:hypothetical protein
MFENITSAVFIVDKHYKIHNVNNTFEQLFSKQSNEIIGALCGDVIGCGFAYNENKSCGATSHCSICDLRKSSYNSVYQKESMFRKVLTRDFVINDQKFKKHFLYSTKPIHYDNVDMAMIIVDDITETEEQKNIIKEKNKEITQSITYARGIQKTILPHISLIKKTLADSFILYMPKDIISGDFYWISQEARYKYFAVADCTGHGVPGAIMSMLGITLLNEIVRNKKISKASEILDLLRSEIIKYLKQKGKAGEHKDGMDIALCVIDTKTIKGNVKMQYSGANIPLRVLLNDGQTPVKNEKNESHEKILELKPDKQPIGIFVEMKPFKNHNLTLKKGDAVYLCTDGFEDQFGGPDKKKYKTSKLRDFLTNINHLPMDEQQHEFEIEFLKWKMNNDQVDDVTVMGVRL